MTKRIGGPALFALLALTVAGCPHPKGDSGDAGGAGGSQGEATNAGDVTRFSDETPFGPEATIGHDRTVVRKAPGSGDMVATLPAGTDVVKLAAHGEDVLVCFDDPKPPGQHLMGWVPQSALQDAVPPPPPSPGPAPAPTMDDGGAPPPPPSPTPHGHHHKGKKGHKQQPPQQSRARRATTGIASTGSRQQANVAIHPDGRKVSHVGAVGGGVAGDARSLSVARGLRRLRGRLQRRRRPGRERRGQRRGRHSPRPGRRREARAARHGVADLQKKDLRRSPRQLRTAGGRLRGRGELRFVQRA